MINKDEVRSKWREREFDDFISFRGDVEIGQSKREKGMA